MSTTTSAAPARKALTMSWARATVLRALAATLPGGPTNARELPLSRLGEEIARLRETYDYDLQTAEAIDAWLSLFRGEP